MALPLTIASLLQFSNAVAVGHEEYSIILTSNDTTATISDAIITATTKAKLLADSRTSGLKITVTTNNGVVAFSGKVTNEAGKAATT